MRSRSALLAAVALLLTASPARCDEFRKPEVTAESKALAQKIVQAVCRNSEELRSGVLRAEGLETYTDREVDPPRVYTAKVALFCMFDFDAQTIRFDRKPMKWQPDAGVNKVPSLSSGGQLLVTPESTLLRMAEDQFVLMNRRDAVISQVELFRVDFAGIATRREMTILQGQDWETRGLQQFFSGNRRILGGDARVVAKRLLPEEQLTAVDHTSGPLVSLKWQIGVAQDAVHSVVFNESAGWMPVRMRRRYLRPRAFTPEGRNAARFVSREESNVQWQKMGEVYVPISLSQREEFSMWGASRESIRELTLSIDWESVNIPPDKACFTLKGLGFPDDVRVIDRRNWPPRFIER